ncbi:hypothetical protein ACIRU3_18825 [Streptomyces sp. NPDC101151]|uniref:hypothetical protein n=1 Tax=Streptomyces sp. NPDC101151 TaxID=3366115 RepID=UPI00380F90C4
MKTSGTRPTARRLTALACVAAATLAGCSASDHGSAPDRPAGQVRRAPGDAEGTLHLAEQLLIKRCMEKQGYKYWIEDREPDDSSHRFPYVMDDVRWATTHGYGNDLHRKRAAEVVRDPNQRYFRSQPADRRTVLLSAINGPRPSGLTARLPTGQLVTHSDQGCVADAERRLYQDLSSWFRATRVTSSLAGLRIGLVLQDKRYRAATGAWAHCMRGKGYSYGSPAEARTAATAPEREWPHGKEVRQATAEATCAQSTGLASTAKSLDAKYRSQLARRHPRETADRARLAREALPRAREVIARAG